MIQLKYIRGQLFIYPVRRDNDKTMAKKETGQILPIHILYTVFISNFVTLHDGGVFESIKNPSIKSFNLSSIRDLLFHNCIIFLQGKDDIIQNVVTNTKYKILFLLLKP